MKKITFLMLTMLAFCWQSIGQVQVGSDTGTSTNVPITSCYGYSYSQQIYFASDINASGAITALSFYLDGATSTANFADSDDWTVYLGHSARTEFTSTSDWEPLANLTQAYTGIVTFPAEDNWFTITLDTPFTYNGTDNLVVAIDENKASYNCSMYWRKTDGAANTAMYYRSDSTNPDPASPVDASGRLSYTSNIIFDGIAQSCPSPSALSATNISSTTADLQWTENGTATSWNIVYGEAGFNPDTEGTTVASSANPYAVTGLLSNTSYEFYVQADCGLGELSSRVGPISFTTACASMPLGYSADFDNNVPDACWSEATEGEIVDGPSSFGSSNWYASQYVSGSETIQTNVINLYTNTFREWLVSPDFDIPATGNYQLEIAVIHGGTTAMTVDEPFGSDDEVQLLMTIDNGATWTNLRTWNSSNDPGIAGEYYVQDLTAALGSTVRFAFFGSDGAVNDPEDTYFAISKFLVRETPTCLEPTALTATNITTTGADLDWTIGDTETAWNLEYGETGFTQGTGTLVSETSVKPYNVSGLNPATTYEYYVQAFCGTGDESAWVGPFSFTTLCAAFTAPVTESFENGGTIPNCWSTYSSGAREWSFATSPTFGNSYSDHTSGSGYFAFVDASTSSTATDATLETPEFDVTSLTSPYLKFYLYHFVAGGTNSNTITVDVWDGAAWNQVYMDDNGNIDAWEMVGLDLSSLTITGNVKVRFVVDTETNSNYENDIAIDDMSIIEAPACPEPISLNVANITLDSADLSWSAGASETEWEYALQLATDPAPTAGTSITTTTYTATGLTENTDYVFYVRAVCGGDFSPFVTTAFTTLALGQVCESAIEVTALPYNTTDDTVNYGDDYSGSPGASCGTTSGYLGGDDVVYSYTATADGTINVALSQLSGSYSGIFAYTDCADIGTACVGGAFNTSSTDYDFDLAVTTGTTYYFVISTWPSPQSISYTLDITEVLCADPTALGVTNVTDVSVDLSWTNGTESSWNIEYGAAGFTQGTGGTLLPGVTTNPYALTGLTASTSYDFYVQAICDSGDLSAWVGPFNFSTACDQTPVDVPFLEDFEATICGTVINEGTGNQWMPSTLMGAGFTTNHMRYSYNSTNPADSWYFTQAINLVAGQEYYISYDFGNDSIWDEKMKVAYGTANTSAAMTTVLADYPTVTGGALQSDNVTFTAPTTGVYYFGFHAYSDANMNQLRLDNVVVDQTLSTDSFNSANLFSYYPNPVENTLTLKGVKNIQNVTVLNMLGQEVLRVAPNAVNSQVDMSNLQSGAYFVKVTIENATNTIKIIKE